jgi:hypothetical protein
MNKQKDRYTPFSGKYKMPVDEFCNKYGLSLKVVMHRMNVLFWEDFDSLVIPQEVGDTSADKIRRILTMLSLGWSKESIQRRAEVDLKTIDIIESMDEYRKNMFLTMDNYFYLNPNNVDLSKIFVDGDNKEVVM